MTYLRIGRVLLRRRRASRTVDALAAGGRLRQTGAAEAPSSPRLGPGLANGHMALIQGPVACVCLALAHREGSCGLAETPRRRDAPQQRRRGANSKDGFVRLRLDHLREAVSARKRNWQFHNGCTAWISSSPLLALSRMASTLTGAGVKVPRGTRHASKSDRPGRLGAGSVSRGGVPWRSPWRLGRRRQRQCELRGRVFGVKMKDREV